MSADCSVYEVELPVKVSDLFRPAELMMRTLLGADELPPWSSDD